MSKESRIEVLFETNELLHDLEYDKKMDEYAVLDTKKKEVVAAIEPVKEHVYSLVSAVQADTVLYKGWLSTIVKPKAKAKKLNTKKFMHNLMIMGKLSADLVAAIVAASQDDPKPITPYIKITAPGEKEDYESE